MVVILILITVMIKLEFREIGWFKVLLDVFTNNIIFIVVFVDYPANLITSFWMFFTRKIRSQKVILKRCLLYALKELILCLI